MIALIIFAILYVIPAIANTFLTATGTCGVTFSVGKSSLNTDFDIAASYILSILVDSREEPSARDDSCSYPSSESLHNENTKNAVMQ